MQGELTTVERVICTHGDLAALDVELAAAYREALARAPTLSARKALQTDQARWRGRRNECDAQEPMQDCIAALYKARLAQLRAGGSGSSPARAGGDLSFLEDAVQHQESAARPRMSRRPSPNSYRILTALSRRLRTPSLP